MKRGNQYGEFDPIMFQNENNVYPSQIKAGYEVLNVFKVQMS